jgi:prephenate dehydrogenase
MINAPLWTELFLTNREALLAHITAFEQALGEYRAALEREDAPALIEAMQGVREKRVEMTKR